MVERTILIADDDPHILDVVCFAVEHAGMRVHIARNGAEALSMFEQISPDLVVLDIAMPEMDGLTVCRQIRKTSEVPILFLTSHDSEIDRVLGLELGGDDFVTKPFSPRELVARIRAILKRTAPTTILAGATQNHIIEYQGLMIDTVKHLVQWQQHALDLTATEFAILQGMAQQPGRVFRRQQIMDMAYPDNIHISDRTIDSHIRNLRQKLARAHPMGLIHTVHGIGYRFGT